jgi:chemotaxis protein MotB
MSGQTIIIKRVRRGGAGHHGGAWKVAYADFVTAMMAFFLLLWLLNAVSQEQLEGISDYFSPITTEKATSGGGGLMQGQTVDIKGVFNAREKRTGANPLVPAFASTDEAEDAMEDLVSAYEQAAESETKGDSAKAAEAEEQIFGRAAAEIREGIEQTPEFAQLAKSLLIDSTPEGLRIQVIDQEGLAMFPRGSADLYSHARKLLSLITDVIHKMPQRINIIGHTDATRYQGGAAYTNWELSADRANAARRLLIEQGFPEDRLSQVVGKAATEPLVANDPSAPGNRRLTILLLRGSAAKG